MSLLATIKEYDLEQQEIIFELRQENRELRRKYFEAVEQLASYVATVDRMKLELILSGSLRRPEFPPHPTALDEAAEDRPFVDDASTTGTP